MSQEARQELRKVNARIKELRASMKSARETIKSAKEELAQLRPQKARLREQLPAETGRKAARKAARANSSMGQVPPAAA
ncbi:hypothetical protein [Microbacterium suaedae]|uniref:hypothetical protein n=1 Tax=Microbacterium suaedae TaxID=2067813 RepID=UPI000DACCE7D|nr:hypothetical protein [Microbacterium suaedae]